jgi:putative membrane protein
MLRMLLHWIASAACLLVVAHLVPGFEIRGGFGTALWAALLIGLINSTLGLLLKIVTFPLTIVTLGLFWFVINALMIEFASGFVSGFIVRGFVPAFVGGLILSLLNLIVRAVL